jgi:hypothetical protein
MVLELWNQSSFGPASDELIGTCTGDESRSDIINKYIYLYISVDMTHDKYDIVNAFIYISVDMTHDKYDIVNVYICISVA